MGFVRNWDSSCPRTWDSWEADGKKWVIQDLPPEDDEAALQLLLEHLCTDEVLCKHNNIVDDPESMRGIAHTWRKYLAMRTALACYVEDNGKRELVAVNVTVIEFEGQQADEEIFGEKWKNVYNVLAYLEKKVNQFEYLGTDKVLYAMGLVVKREYRGARLGARMLTTREPLCKYFGISGTATVFTGPASQISAERAGFETIATANMKELADDGFDYPRDEKREIKLMVKKYN